MFRINALVIFLKIIILIAAQYDKSKILSIQHFRATIEISTIVQKGEFDTVRSLNFNKFRLNLINIVP